MFLLGNSKETLDIHNGKNHADSFECGLCESIFEKKEDLETHLNTCESESVKR